MMKMYRFLILFSIYGALSAQEEQILSQDWVIPRDCEVITGQLDNGLTYYVRENKFPKDRASLRLVVKAGSLHEEEHQRGLAHFLEHMLFRGTKHFQDWEIINFLESIGAQFGADTNAATGFDNTTYMLEIPLDKEGILEKSILILSDWAARAKLEDTMIDKERSVIMDEYNLSQKNVGSKVSEKLLDHFLKSSLYPQRLPIGQKDVILKGDPQAIRDFYKKWYTPDRMAVIAVGDFDSEAVVSAIRESFGDIEPGTEKITEPNLFADFSDEKNCFFAHFPELMGNQGGFCRFYNLHYRENVTRESLKSSLVSDIKDTIFNERLVRSSKKNPPPYLHAQSIQLPVANKIEGDALAFVFFEDRLFEGLKAFCEEVQILNTFGPEEEEFSRVLDELRHELELNLENMDRVNHSMHSKRYISHFLNGADYLDLLAIYQTKLEILEEITIQDLMDEETIDLSEFHPFFLTIKELAQEEVKDQLLLMRDLEVMKPEEKRKENLVTQASDLGKIVSEEVKDSYHTYEFSNGLKLVVHPSQLETNDVQLLLIAKGGKTLFPLEYSPSIPFAATYLLESGLGNIDGQRIQEVLAAQGIDLGLIIEQNNRAISINGKSSDVELIFETIKAIFLEKRFDPNVWESLLLKYGELEKNQYNNSLVFFGKKLDEIIHSSHPYYDISSVNQAKEEDAKEIASKAFGDPGEFTLIVVGDIDPQFISQLAHTHLSFTPPQPAQWKCYSRPIDTFPTETVDIVIEKGKETHCTNAMVYQGAFSFNESRKTFASLDALTHILQSRLLEKMRREMGETYSVNCISAFPFRPELDDLKFFIVFSCQEEKSDLLKQCAQNEIARLMQEPPKEEEIDAVREILFQKAKKALQSNYEWVELHRFQIFYKGEFSMILDYPTYLKQEVTAGAVQTLARELFDNKPVVKATLVAEK